MVDPIFIYSTLATQNPLDIFLSRVHTCLCVNTEFNTQKTRKKKSDASYRGDEIRTIVKKINDVLRQSLSLSTDAGSKEAVV
ncbi:hypothetical protein Bca4012_037490 [Brassica carinata]